MNKIFLVIVLSFFSIASVNSQVTWEKLIVNDSADVFRHIEEDNAGGYVVSGYVVQSLVRDSDAYVIRFTSTGDTSWTFAYNGALSDDDLFYKAKPTSDGGYIACGYTKSVTGVSDDILYVKLNSSGQMQWAKTYGNTGKERAQDVVETSDGYTIVGYSTSPPAQYYDALIIHTDFNGDILWTKLVGNSNYDDANTIKVLADGGYILGGQSAGAGGLDQFLIRMKADGDTLWTKRFGTPGTDNIECLILVSDGFILAGNTSTAATGDDGYLVKTDTSGNVIWTKVFGGSDQDDFHSVDQTNDGGFILGGTTSSSGRANPNMWLFKTAANGDSSWAETFGGDNHDHGYCAISTSDGGYAFVGHSGSFGFHREDAFIIKTNGNGFVSDSLTYICAYELVSPTCASTNSEVRVSVRNFGNQMATNITVSVDITGGITQTLNKVIPVLHAQDVVTVSFTPVLNTVGVGSLTFHGYTSTNNDVIPANNSFTKTVNLTPCVGIEELQVNLGVNVFPNPSDGNFEISFSENYLKANIEIFNSIGESVNQFSIENTNGVKKSIDLTKNSPGIYLMKLTTEKGFDVRRIIIF